MVFCDFAKYKIEQNKILILQNFAKFHRVISFTKEIFEKFCQILILQNDFAKILQNTFCILQDFVVFLVSQKKFLEILSNTYFAK